MLGVAYKKDVDDPRESPAFEILEMLQARGAIVTYNDPHVPTLPRMRHHSLRLDSQPLTPEFLAEQDCVLVVTDHSAFDYDFIAAPQPAAGGHAQRHGGLSSAGDCRIVKA